MKFTNLLRYMFPSLLSRGDATKAAKEFCRSYVCDEPILGTIICANEPERYVVRVFCGYRKVSVENYLLPPWENCLIFAVAKDSYCVEQITDDEKYRPTIL
ncbi:MAG: hypothetical protein H7Z37_00180 [Pyrinomonadaceae bacterium]|nr:hypothetical protein [Pyrinomonadaceae bacterium]